MPELVVCPSCGCGMQAPELAPGQQVRCFGCRRLFVPGSERQARPARSAPPPDEDHPPPRPTLNRCPCCGQHLTWSEPACHWCGAEWAPGRTSGPPRWIRRDCLPHRARFIHALGTVCVIAGCLSLCLVGLGSLLSIPLGVTVWLMANRDLKLMQSGQMDPTGRPQTEDGRINAIVAVVLGLLFAPLLVLALHLR